MSKVYAVGVLQLDTSENARKIILSDRLWFLYAKFEDAERCVLENRSDIFEYYYNYALIEEIGVIDPDSINNDWEFPPKEWWYKAVYEERPDGSSEPVISPCEKPKCLDRTACFWAG